MAADRVEKDIYNEFVPFYDLSYADRQAEVAFYTSLLRDEDRSVLELGCGTGTIVAAIEQYLSVRYRHESKAVGIDRSILMLEWARARYPNVAWIQADLTRPPFNQPFDLIVCAFNTLQMLDSDASMLRALRAARDLLSPHGTFVFDIYNASFQETSRTSPEARINRVVRSFRDPDGRLLEVQEDALEDDNGESVRLDWRVMDTSTSPPALRARLLMRLRHYSPSAMENLLRDAGLRIVERFGDVRKAPFDEQGSKKQVVVCSL